MDKEINLKARDWERLLTPAQQEKYRNVIRRGYFSDYHGINWRHDTFFGAFLWKHPDRVRVVMSFESLVGHRPTWEDITDDNLRDLFEDLSGHYSPNSMRTICAEVKAVIRENGKTRNVSSENFGTILRRKSVPVQSVYLNDKEVNKIIKYSPRGAYRRLVHRLFVIECLTGARMSDCRNITPENIDESGKFIVYVSKKSKVEVKVPIDKRLRPFLVCGTGDEPSCEIPRFTYNRIIQEICYDCGITTPVKVYRGGKSQYGQKWEFVSSHTGRRSFATNLALKGVSLEQIALLMGHMSGNVANIQMTQRYICDKMRIDRDVLKIFGVYDNEKKDEESEARED